MDGGYGHAVFPGGTYSGMAPSQQHQQQQQQQQQQQVTGNPYLQFQQQQQHLQQQQYHQPPPGHHLGQMHQGMHHRAASAPRGFVPAAGATLGANEAFFYCDPCHTPFETAQELQHHFATAHQATGRFNPRDDYFVCAACNRAFGSAHAVGDHHRSVHGGVVAKVDRTRGVGKPLGHPEDASKPAAAGAAAGGAATKAAAAAGAGDPFLCGVCRRTDFPSAYTLAQHAGESHDGTDASQVDLLVCGICDLAFRDADSHAGHWAHHHALMGDIDMGRPVSAAFHAGAGAGAPAGEDAWLERLSGGPSVSGVSTLAVVDTDTWPAFSKDPSVAAVVPSTHALAVVHREGQASEALTEAVRGKGFLVEAPKGAGCDSAILLKVGAWSARLGEAGVAIVVASTSPVVAAINGHGGVRVVAPGKFE